MMLIESVRLIGSWLSTRLHVTSERGATAVEYAVMVALIAAVIILAVVFLGKTASSTFSCTGQAVSTKTGAC
jgi:pilus assembly protein Flp/PilA